jgi:hypothetical protein
MEVSVELEGRRRCPSDDVEEVHEELSVGNVHAAGRLAKSNSHKHRIQTHV